MYNLIFVAVCCSMLQCVAVCCGVLQYVVVCRSEYQRLIERGSAGSVREGTVIPAYSTMVGVVHVRGGGALQLQRLSSERANRSSRGGSDFTHQRDLRSNNASANFLGGVEF